MSKALVDVSTWPANITCPEDGDFVTGAAMETFIQQLANRTKFLNDAIAQILPYVDYFLSGTSIASGSKFTLTERVVSGGFVLASNEITFPSVGVYDVSLTARMSSSDTTNPRVIAALLQLDGNNIESANNTRFSATAGDYVSGSVRALIEVDDVAKKLSVVSAHSSITMSSESRLVIRRIS